MVTAARGHRRRRLGPSSSAAPAGPLQVPGRRPPRPRPAGGDEPDGGGVGAPPAPAVHVEGVGAERAAGLRHRLGLAAPGQGHQCARAALRRGCSTRGRLPRPPGAAGARRPNGPSGGRRTWRSVALRGRRHVSRPRRLPGIDGRPHGPAPAEPHLSRHRQAGLGGPQAPPADAVGAQGAGAGERLVFAEQCAEADPVHQLSSQRAAGDGTTRTIPASGGAI